MLTTRDVSSEMNSMKAVEALLLGDSDEDGFSGLVVVVNSSAVMYCLVLEAGLVLVLKSSSFAAVTVVVASLVVVAVVGFVGGDVGSAVVCGADVSVTKIGRESMFWLLTAGQGL